MSKHTELELKLICTDRRMWGRIMTSQSLREIAVPDSKVCQTLEAYYFDTEIGSLQKEKLAYRIRREGEQWIATVKGGGASHGGLHDRQEWNVVVSNAEPDITVFSNTDIGEKLIEVIGDQILNPILITRFERTSLDVIMADGSQIEVAADEGVIIAGSQTAPILEVELELKAGQAAAVVRLGAMLAKEYPLLPESKSKFYRGLKLAGLVTDEPLETNQLIQLDKHMAASEGLRTGLVQLILQVLVAQQLFFENQTQTEALHELRIALRRLRSLLDFSSRLFTDEQYQWYQAELRTLGQCMGVLRDIDVAYENWRQYSQVIIREDKTALGEVLAKYRLKETEKLYKSLYHGLSSPLLLDLWATLIEPQAPKFLEDHLSIQEYVVQYFAAWIKNVSKQSKNIDWTQTDTVHKIRLQIKKIKYVLQVFQPLLREIPQFSVRLDVLQDKLGLLTDYASIDNLFRTLLTGKATKALHLEIGMIIGWNEYEKMFIQNKMDKYWKKFHNVAKKWEWNK
ncbi:CHAD domain-containing protein [Pelosinus sp. sgz500959]|uniref:CYTH and CHAD domain-containing protein n=1 Tax=Pelosinus sp. sgz500959 TaxID=3242472 RepID=UPI003670D761